MKQVLSLSLISLVALLGCSRDIPSDPMCRVNDNQTPLEPAPSACLVKLNQKLLVLQTNQSEHFTLPLTKRQQTSAQCTAHQGVWKTTGLNVKVNQLLYVDKSNVHYFSCEADTEFASDLTQLPVPPWANQNIKHISLVNPFKTQQHDWHETIDVIALRDAFTRLEAN